MSSKKIENGRYWNAAWQLIDGCTPCSPGCDHCWSAGMTHRIGAKVTRHVFESHIPSPFTNPDRKFNGKIKLHWDRLSIPLKRRKPTVFSCWNDLFHEAVPVNFLEESLAVMTNCPQHTFLVLTKRAQRLNLMTSDRLRVSRTDTWPIKNLWLGITVCNQQEMEAKGKDFFSVPGNKFLSLEPLLSKVIIPPWVIEKHLLSAVICGGETGPGARPMHPDWVRSVRDQCAAAGVPFFLKSLGEWLFCDDMIDRGMSWREDKHEFFEGFRRVGKQTAGRLLVGRTHNDLPWRVI